MKLAICSFGATLCFSFGVLFYEALKGVPDKKELAFQIALLLVMDTCREDQASCLSSSTSTRQYQVGSKAPNFVILKHYMVVFI